MKRPKNKRYRVCHMCGCKRRLSEVRKAKRAGFYACRDYYACHMNRGSRVRL